MAKVQNSVNIESQTGRISSKSDLCFRQKHIRDEQGRVLHTGVQELYRCENPRDWKKTPALGAEKVHFDLWTEACRRAALESKPDHPNYESWRERWRNQLQTPDPLCEPNKKTRRKQCYYQFDCFVRVAILWQLRKELNCTFHQ